MLVTWQGRSAPIASQDKMTPGEVGAVERELAKEFGDKTFTFQKLRRMGDLCVCDHKSADHRHKDEAGDPIWDDTSCARCDCEEHEANVSPLVQIAFMWISLRRAHPTVKWSDVRDAPLTDFEIVQDADDAAGPTTPHEGAPTS